MVETNAPTDPMTAYYNGERDSLNELVAKGILREVKALNGTMYVMSLGGGDFPIAVSKGDLIVRAGDTVSLERPDADGKPVKGIMLATNFHVNQGNGEIEFDHVNNVPSMLRVNDMKSNLSALQRHRATVTAAKPAA